MTTIDRISELLGKVEEDVKKSTVQDILIDLKDFASEATDAQKAGLQFAIQIIKSNYVH